MIVPICDWVLAIHPFVRSLYIVLLIYLFTDIYFQISLQGSIFKTYFLHQIRICFALDLHVCRYSLRNERNRVYYKIDLFLFFTEQILQDGKYVFIFYRTDAARWHVKYFYILAETQNYYRIVSPMKIAVIIIVSI